MDNLTNPILSTTLSSSIVPESRPNKMSKLKVPSITKTNQPKKNKGKKPSGILPLVLVLTIATILICLTALSYIFYKKYVDSPFFMKKVPKAPVSPDEAYQLQVQESAESAREKDIINGVLNVNEEK
jgi:hypothetical protein